MNYPPFPRNAEEIKSYAGYGEYMACAIVKRHDVRQLMTFRRLRLALGNRRFLDVLVEALDILSRSSGITNPAGWLCWYLKEEAAAHAQV